MNALTGCLGFFLILILLGLCLAVIADSGLDCACVSNLRGDLF